ncbi:hypothetical protein K435DRAFT_855988 [Dendrothele bispora CBS 962.96]|uniref:DUF659 domain-containing protein n=1 Tax=Dendrothele bispora (strain CBS 962.96) TaxID=1314807 RepID=A0A4S8MB55_DENBC|nr:hypothetical protein K435DRAFT_855988 [Dendrothele bispora CBS 962.96]
MHEFSPGILPEWSHQIWSRSRLESSQNGGSKKGRVLLGKRHPWLIVLSCWAHQFQLTLGDYFKVYEFGAKRAEEATFLIGWLNNHGKVRKIFDAAQEQITKDQLQLVVMQSRSAIIAAQVGAAKGEEAERLQAEAEQACNLIADGRERRYSFWSGLELVISDIKPICYGTNINQKDSTQPDQVLLSIAGIYLHFAAHLEPELSVEMLYRRMNLHPNNEDSVDVRKEKEKQVQGAVYKYMATTGPFEDFAMHKEQFRETMGSDPTAASVAGNC